MPNKSFAWTAPAGRDLTVMDIRLLLAKVPPTATVFLQHQAVGAIPPANALDYDADNNILTIRSDR